MKIAREASWVSSVAVIAAAAGLAVQLASVRAGADAEERRLTGNGSRAADGLVNWESPHVHPLELTPDRSTLLAVNTADNRLEVFAVAPDGSLSSRGAVPVGLDPVSVRAGSNSRAWVVNHISDSVSVVDLATMNVVRTLRTADEPADVVFAGQPARAFVTCSQANLVQVFDAADPTTPIMEIPIEGEDPRALAVSPDGSTVYAAVFESGNRTTLLAGGADPLLNGTLGFPPNVVNDPAGPYGGLNPPPNDGNVITPPPRIGNPPPPKVGLIVRQDDQGRWMDDNSGDWTDLVSGPDAALSGRPVGWHLVDHDVAIIDADSGSITGYATGLMNICMALAVNPASGRVTVVGTDATNEVRFEPNVTGTFTRVRASSVDAAGTDPQIADLNAHLDYSVGQLPQAVRDVAIGDPRGIVWSGDGVLGYVAGMGSNNVVVIDESGLRAGLAPTIEVGQGPTGLALNEPADRLYVLNKFDGAISVIDTTSETPIAVTPFFDPTPDAIRVGRKHLYDTHKNSGLGQIACASCHVDARMDRLGWDLGDPAGAVAPLAGNNLGAGIPGLEPNTTPVPFNDFHPMKGPMSTQTLQNIIGLEPHHWRGDRNGLEQFGGAFIGLQGDDTTLTPEEMQEFEDFLATIAFPPNPFRNLDNTLATSVPLPGHYATGDFALPAGDPLPPGNAVNGMNLYRSTTRRLDGGAFACVTCHTLPTGAGTDMVFQGGQFRPIPIGPRGEHHLMLVSVDGSTNRAIKTPQLRNAYEKTGFNMTKTANTAGFGFLHDGSIDSLERFIGEPAFNIVSDQEIADMVAFVHSMSGSELPGGQINNILRPPGPPSLDTHAAVGRQVTVVDGANVPPADAALIAQLLAQADAGKIGVVVKGKAGGVARGYVYRAGGTFQSDRISQTLTAAALLAQASAGNELTYTAVPLNTQDRIGIDRDRDGSLDADETAVCADPADPESFPGAPGNADVNADLVLNIFDFLSFQTLFSLGDPQADFDGNGVLNVFDFLGFQTAFGACS